MKRSLLLLLVLCLLTGCGTGETGTTENAEGGTLPPRESAVREEEPLELSDAFSLTTEWATYAPDTEWVWFTVENRSGAEAGTGSDYRLERLKENGAWSVVPFREDIGWDAILYMIPDGGVKAFSCWMEAFDYDFPEGTYRIVKELDGGTCAGEFTISADAAAPYGPALEDLPEDYDADAALADGAAVFTDAGAAQLEAVDVFVEKVGLGIPCRLRVVQAYNENVPMVTDVVYEDDRFRWAMRQDGMYFDQWFAYLLTDGADLYLGNSAAWDWEGDKRTLLSPECSAGAAARVEEMTSLRLEGNVTRYKVWSPDGEHYAGLAEDPMEFFCGGEGWGRMDTVAAFDLPEDFESLKTVKWVDDNTFRLTDGKGWSADVDVAE